VNKYLSDTVDQSLNILAESCCIDFEEDGKRVLATTLGRIASYYYLSHETVEHFEQSLSGTMTAEQLLKILTDCKEFAEMPVRHNEDLQNTELAKQCPIKLNAYAMDSPHQKVHLLLQSHFCRNQLPNSDYGTDTRSVMDQAIRILQAMIDVVADAGWLSTTLRVQILLQMIIQGCWGHESSLMQLPHIDSFGVKAFRKARIDSLPGLIHSTGSAIKRGILTERIIFKFTF
jgi:activating signal cointegrator complex subunit 3